MSIDQLLSGEELLTAASEDNVQKSNQLKKLVFALMDTSCILLFFLPLFAQRTAEKISEVSLLSLTEISPYTKSAYIMIVTAIVICGIISLALQNCSKAFWQKNSYSISLSLNTAGVLLFIVSLQPYAAVFLFAFVAIKVMIVIKKQ